MTGLGWGSSWFRLGLGILRLSVPSRVPLCFMWVPYVCDLYVCLVYVQPRVQDCRVGHALYVCLTCVPCMCALHVCLVCVPYMCVLYVCLMYVQPGV